MPRTRTSPRDDGQSQPHTPPNPVIDALAAGLARLMAPQQPRKEVERTSADPLDQSPRIGLSVPNGRRARAQRPHGQEVA